MVLPTYIFVGLVLAPNIALGKEPEFSIEEMKDAFLQMEQRLSVLEKEHKTLQGYTRTLEQKLEQTTIKHEDKEAELEAKICGLEKELIERLRREKKMERRIQSLFSRLRDENVSHELGEPSETTVDRDQDETVEIAKDSAANQLGDVFINNRNVKRSKKRQLIRNTTQVAFSAYLTERLSFAAIDHIIQYKGITLNEGGAYNQYTGIFTAPVSGVYLFSYFVDNPSSRLLRVKLVVNGTRKSSAVTYHYGGSSYQSSAGNMALLRIVSGQSVWVAIDAPGDYVEGSATYKVSTFSGVYLYP